jgi:hypothetical protein
METLQEQARRLSSGTIASLTGERTCEAVDAIRLDFMQFCEESQVKTWIIAWQQYANKKESSCHIKFASH